MIDLCIRVKVSAQQISSETATEKLRLNSRFAIVHAVLIAAFGILNQMTLGDYLQNLENTNPGHDTSWKVIFSISYVPVALFYLTIILFTASIYLVIITRRYFRAMLKAEACRVQTINIVFSSAYLTRAIAFFLTHTRWPGSIDGF